MNSPIVDPVDSAAALHAASTFLTVPTDSSPQSQVKRKLWERLNSLQRALLATDGSFTLLLAALYGEPIKTELLQQRSHTLKRTDPLLQLEAGDVTQKRHVLLRTASSDRPVAYAESLIAGSRLSLPIRHGLQDGSKPIGLLLRRQGWETHRIMHDWGTCASPAAARTFLGRSQLLFRTYTIVARALPITLISEYFSVPDNGEVQG